MASGRTLLGIGLALGSLAGAAFVRGRVRRPRERVDLYFEDGSLVSLNDESVAAQRLLPLGRRLLETARP